MSPCVPESAVRKNITQRRSRGRTKDEGNLVPDVSMVSRRPRSRSKDRRYSIESVGIWSPPEQSFTEWQDWRPATAVVEPRTHVASTSEKSMNTCRNQLTGIILVELNHTLSRCMARTSGKQNILEKLESAQYRQYCLPKSDRTLSR